MLHSVLLGAPDLDAACTPLTTGNTPRVEVVTLRCSYGLCIQSSAQSLDMSARWGNILVGAVQLLNLRLGGRGMVQV